MLCKNCGNQIADNLTICPNCNSVIENTDVDNNKKSSKNFNKLYRKISASIICLFLGYLGIHRLYMGYKRSGLVMLSLAVVWFIPWFLLYFLSWSPKGVAYVFGGYLLTLGLCLVICTLFDLGRILMNELVPKESSPAFRIFPD